MDADSRLSKFADFTGLKFPLSEEKLAELVQSIRKRNDLPRPSRPEVPRFSSNVSPAIRCGQKFDICFLACTYDGQSGTRQFSISSKLSNTISREKTFSMSRSP